MNTRWIWRAVTLVALLLSACTAGQGASMQQMLLGSWTSTVTKEDLVRVVPSFPSQYECENSGTFLWKFNQDGTFTIDQTALDGCPAPANARVEDKWSLDGNLLTLAPGTPDQEVYDVSINNDALTFKAKQSPCVPCIATNTAHPWKRVP